MMNTSLTYRGYGVSYIEYAVSDEIEAMKKELTVKSWLENYGGNNKNDSKEEPGFPVFLESSKKIYIPKHYGLHKYGTPLTNKIKNGDVISDDVVFNGSLRSTQTGPVQTFLEKARDPMHMGGILQLPPGWGKTVMALYIFAVLRTKTLVIVHKDFLLKQWKERIEYYLPNARIGLIKQNKFQTDDCDIVLGSLQTICKRDLKEDLGFGFVIVDECHHMGAQVFSQAFHKLNFKYSLGLSATVTRIDGLTKVFKWFIGDVVFKAKRDVSGEIDLVVKKEIFCDDNPAYKQVLSLYNGKPNMARMLNNICEYKPRTYFLVDQLFVVLNMEPSRNVIILSDRRQHLIDIKDRIINVKSSFVDKIGFYVGGMKSDDLAISETKQILLGTYNMVSEGFDLPKLDTLLMASPKSQVEQSIGRIQRQLPKDRLHTPIVIDIIDNFSVFKNQATKRAVFYKKNGYGDNYTRANYTGEDEGKGTEGDVQLIGKPMFVLE
jgi:superfamily II DNA or RNA helicase